MTEADWLAATDPHVMLEAFPELGQSGGFGTCSCCRVECRTRVGWCPVYRRLRLFALACCQRIQHTLTHPHCITAIKALDTLIEGRCTDDEYWRVALTFDATRRARYPMETHLPEDHAWTALYCAVHRRWQKYLDEDYAPKRWWTAYRVSQDAAEAVGADEPLEQVRLLHDIFHNPFRPSPFDPRWRTETAVALAAGIYAERAFDRLPILADALEEAGCDAVEVLSHLRGPGPHARGCWVVDEVLGKC